MQSRLLDKVTVVTVTLLLEGVLLLVSALWVLIGQIDLAPQFVLGKHNLIVGIIAGACLAGSGFTLLFLAKLSKGKLPWLNSLREIVLDEVAPLFAEMTLVDIALIALASGFCEEVFFRGVMQRSLGYLPTSALFGLFHCPSPRHLSYGLWALAAGLLMGYLLERTGSLWTPIIAHALSNLIVILYLRYARAPAQSA